MEESMKPSTSLLPKGLSDIVLSSRESTYLSGGTETIGEFSEYVSLAALQLEGVISRWSIEEGGLRPGIQVLNSLWKVASSVKCSEIAQIAEEGERFFDTAEREEFQPDQLLVDVLNQIPSIIKKVNKAVKESIATGSAVKPTPQVPILIALFHELIAERMELMGESTVQEPAPLPTPYGVEAEFTTTPYVKINWEGYHSMLSELRTMHRKFDSTDPLDLRDQLAMLISFGDDLRRDSLTPLFSKLRQVVVGTAEVLGRKVKFSTSGADMLVDRWVQEKLLSIGSQLIRNSIDHGFERDLEGEIKLDVVLSGSSLLVTFSDDGKGIDWAEVTRVGKEMGLKGKGEELIFCPGFSTRSDNPSQYSGRGIGLDRVAEEVRELDGKITVSSESGEGTTVKIELLNL
jgi:hypothetical protein